MARAPAAILALALAGLSLPAPAQEAADSGGEAESGAEATPPAILDPGAPEGAELTARTVRPFDRYRLPVGPYSRDSAAAEALEGRVIRSAWRLADPEATTAAVMAGYADRLGALGYAPVFRCTTEECGGLAFRFAVELMPPPAMLMDAADFAQLSARRDGAGTETHVSVLVSRILGAVYAQTVAVAPAEAALPVAPAPDAAAETRPPPPDDAEALVARLESFGHLPLHGIAFETGSTEITGASAPALDRAAAALAARPGMAVLIVGHSDNVGALEDNIALSRRRAEAVRAALVARGVAQGRLEARGVGFLAPIASNASPEGRALNRRVELVLR